MGKLDIHMQKNEIRSISITLRKNLIQVDQRPQFETWNAKTAMRKHRLDPRMHSIGKNFPNMPLFA